MNGIARCGNCLYFCPQEKTSVGCNCANYHMNKRRHTKTASLKQPSSAPCSQYIKDPDKTYIPKKREMRVTMMDKLGTIDEIVSEYITNSDYNASDAMEDIIQVLDEQEPHYYNRIKRSKDNE